MFLTNAALLVAVLVFCCAFSGVTSRRHVEKMQIVVETEDDMKSESDFQPENLVDSSYRSELFHYMNAATDFKSTSQNTLLQLGSFKWQNCGSSSDLLVINDLTVTPDPLKTPGVVSLKFDISIQDTFTAPLKLVLELEKHEAFFWLHIPCIDGKGSCTYDDICQQLASITCPKPFLDNKIPCKCPFTKGHYSLPSSTFTMPVSVPSGEYSLKAEVSSGSQSVNCVQVWFNVA